MEDSRERGPNYEQKQWEEDHLSAALLKFGAKDSKERRRVCIIPVLFCDHGNGMNQSMKHWHSDA